MTELAVTQNTGSELNEQMRFATAVSDGDMLPQAYRGKPANVLVAVGLGAAMGLSFAESLYRIDVIQGKPTASAELIASNVRKAGHKLRVMPSETSCTAQIIRADDPDFTFEITRDMDWAKSMGLMSKDNYKKQAGTMLQWRAISAVARLACPEALYGVTYTPDELEDLGEVSPQTAPTASARLLNATAGATTGSAQKSQSRTKAAEPAPAPTPAPTPAPEPEPVDGTEMMSPEQWTHLNAALMAAGHKTGPAKGAAIQEQLGRTMNGPDDLTAHEAADLLDFFTTSAGAPAALDTDAAQADADWLAGGNA